MACHFYDPKRRSSTSSAIVVSGTSDHRLRSQQLTANYCHSTENIETQDSVETSQCLPLVGWPLILYSGHSSIIGTDISAAHDGSR